MKKTPNWIVKFNTQLTKKEAEQAYKAVDGFMKTGKEQVLPEKLKDCYNGLKQIALTLKEGCK